MNDHQLLIGTQPALNENHKVRIASKLTYIELNTINLVLHSRSKTLHGVFWYEKATAMAYNHSFALILKLINHVPPLGLLQMFVLRLEASMFFKIFSDI